MKNTLLHASHDSISISSWNVHGLGQKHKDDLFLDYIKHDINILLETWKSDETDIDIPNFDKISIFRTKGKKAKRNSGGVIIYVNNEINTGITVLKNVTKSKNRIWLKLNKTFFGFDKDIFLCGIYIPPVCSFHYNNEYENLEKEIKTLSKDGSILLMGDFNSRTSCSTDFILNDNNNEYLETILPIDYKSDFHYMRKSQDRTINVQGRELLDLCVSAKIRILNGRFIGDQFGNITCFNQKGCSVVDYAIASESLLSSVKYFQVEMPTHFSDHSQIIAHLNCFSKIQKPLFNYDKLEYTLKWSNRSKIILEQELFENYTLETITNFQNTEFENNASGVNGANDQLTNIYYNLSLKCMKKCYFKKKKKKKKPWTNSQFLALKNTVNLYSRKMRLSPFDCNIRINFLTHCKKLKKMSKALKKEYKQNLINEISNLSPSESKEFWKILKGIKNNDNKKDLNIDLNQFAQHFKNQGNPEKLDKSFENEININLLKEEEQLLDRDTDNPITISEIKSQIKKLQDGKSSGPDQICYEIIKHSSTVLLTALAKLFNLILNTTLYPQKWNKSFIVPIFKSGDASNLSNYRGISLTNCLSKLFNSIINNRLLEVFQDQMTPSQFGFRKNHRTSDSIFILKTLINKYINREKKKIYGCFIDLKKAFDSVWRVGLLYKILKNKNLGKKLYSVIKNMYSSTEASVKSQNYLSEYVSIDRGVKQGDNLSSLLFNIYINDIPEIFNKECEPVTLQHINLNCLMFADDILLLSETEKGLQQSISNFYDYCNRWQLSINAKKTKIIIFQQKNILDKKHDFFLGKEKLEKVINYKYLGNIIESSGKFHSSHSELAKKGSKVMFSMFSYLRALNDVPIKIYIKLFETLIKPILTYNSEIWYMDFYEKIVRASKKGKENPNFDMITLVDGSFIEKTHLKFCKYTLGLSKHSVNIAARAELARYPLESFIKTQSIKYFIRLIHNTNNPLLDDAFLLSKSLHLDGTYSWYTYVSNICKSNNIDIDEIQNIDYSKGMLSFTKRINKNIQEEYEKIFFNKLQTMTDNNKTYLYSKLKSDYKIDDYLLKYNFENRRNICKMRTSDHFLEIERGRYKRIKREDRLCKMCNENVIENETHYFFHCSKYNEIRKDFETNMHTELSNLNDFDKLIKILSSMDHLQFIAPFIKKSLLLRKVDELAA